MSVTEQAQVCTLEGCGKPWPDHTFEQAAACVHAMDPFGQEAESVAEVIATLRMALDVNLAYLVENPEDGWTRGRVSGLRHALSIVTGIDSVVLEAVGL